MSKSRSAVLIALSIIAALAAGLLFGLNGAGGSAAQPAPAGPSTSAPPSTSQAGSEAEVAASPAPAPQPAPQSQPPAPLPEPQPQPDPGVLEVSPSIINLADNQWSAQFTVKNVGGSDMAWFAVGVPSALSLSGTAGTLAPGQHVTVTVIVDHTQLAKGDFSLKLHVSANDTAQPVTVKGTKQVKPIGPVGPGDLAAKK